MNFFKRLRHFEHHELRSLITFSGGAALLVLMALALSGNAPWLPSQLKVALSNINQNSSAANAAAPAYWSSVYSSDSGYPNQVHFTRWYATGINAYSCNSSPSCGGLGGCGDPFTGAISAIGNTGVAGEVSSSGYQRQTGTAVISPGGSVQLDWSCQKEVDIKQVDNTNNGCGEVQTQINPYANSLSVSGPGLSTSSTKLADTITVNPPGAAGTVANYTLSCKYNGTQTSAVTIPVYITSAVLVLQGCDPDGTNCSPNKTIPAGGKSQLQWNFTNANSCTLTGPSGTVGATGLGSDTSGNSNIWTLTNLDASDQVLDTPTNSYANLNQLYYFVPNTYSKGVVQEAGLAASASYNAVADTQLTSGKWYWEYTPLAGAVGGGYPVGGVTKDATSGFGGRAYAGHQNDTGYGYASDGTVFFDSNAVQMLSGYRAGDTVGVAYDADSGKVYFSKNGQWQNGHSLIPLMASQTNGSVKITASVEYQPAWYVGDRRNSGVYRWQSYPSYPQNTPQWLRVDFGMATTVRSYSIQNYSDTNYAPVDFTLQGSNDATTCAAGTGTAGSVWTVIDVRTAVQWAYGNQTQYFTIATPASYRCYRLNVTKDTSNQEVIIYEFGLYPETAASPTDGTSYAGIVQGGYPSLASYNGKTTISFGQGGGPQDRLGGAGFFPGVTYGFDAAAYSSEFNLQSDYTIDLWAYPTSISTSGGLIGRDNSGGYAPYLVYQNGSSFTFYSAGQSNSWTIASAQPICNNIVANQWYHLAIVRSSNTYYTFCNGVKVSQWVSATAPWASTDVLDIGRQYQGGAYYAGYIDELRISNKARWISNFSPPSGAYASDASTVLLMHFDGNLIDSSSYAHGIGAGLPPATTGSAYYPAAGGVFSFQPPAGYKAISTANWPAPVTNQPNQYFDTKTYTGTGGFQTVSVNFQPDLVWIKNRAQTFWHTLSDSTRGADNDLFSNSTSPATTDDPNGWVSAFNTLGFTVGGYCSAIPANTNASGNSYVAWAWKKSPTAGVDVVTYQGDGAQLRAIAHGLGTTPDTIIIKRTDATSDWYVWNSSLATGEFVNLNTTDAASMTNSPFGVDLIPTMTSNSTGGVSITASTQYSAGTAGWYVGNKSVSDYWEPMNNSNGYPNVGNTQWLRVDLGTSKTVGAYTIALSNRIDASYLYAPTTFTFEGSSDSATCSAADGVAGSVWTILDTEKGVSWVGYNTVKKNFVVPTANQSSYRCYRINITRTGSLEPMIAELNLWAAPINDTSNFVVSHNGVESTNAPGASYVAYVFSNREGLQKSGVYFGNPSSVDSPFIYTGFKPKLVMVKDVSDSNGQWVTWDTTRDPQNSVVNELVPNSAAAESSGSADVDMLSNGFKIKRSATNFNTSQVEYLYIAFADQPFKLSAASDTLTIQNALRFNSSSSYFSRTPSTVATSNKIFTTSFWMKRSLIDGTRRWIFSDMGNIDAFGPSDTQNIDHFHVRIANTEAYYGGALHDPSAWIQVVIAVDTTQAVASNRVKVYFSGVQQALYSGGYPSQNSTVEVNQNTYVQNIGRDLVNAAYYYEGGLADFYMIDGQQLDPTYFGAADGNGYWRPKAYGGTYGTNGFHLDFSNAQNLGADSSGRGNAWGLNNIVPSDQVTDTPTNSYATLGQSYYYSPRYNNGTVQESGLLANTNHDTIAGFQPTSGKWYWEYYPLTGTVTGSRYPVGGVAVDTGSGFDYRAYAGDANDTGFGYGSIGDIYTDGAIAPSLTSSYANGDVIGVAYDADSGKTYFSRNGVWQNGTSLIPQMFGPTTNGVTMSASTFYTTGCEAWRAADRNTGTASQCGNFWYTYTHVPSVASPDWLRVDFGSGNAQTAATYSIKNYAAALGYDPINFTLEGSNDATTCSAGGAVWTTLDTESNLLWDLAGEVKNFTIASPGSYRCYRLKVTGAGTLLAPTNYLIINELGLYAAGQSQADPAAGTGSIGIVQDGVPALDSANGKTRINFGQGGAFDFVDDSVPQDTVTPNDNAAVVAGGKFGSAVSMDGSSDYVKVPMTDNYNLGTGDFTIDFWMKPTSWSNNRGVFGWRYDNNNKLAFEATSPTTMTFRSISASTQLVSLSMTPSIGVWQHVAIVRNGTNWYLFKDGTLVSSATTAANAVPFYIYNPNAAYLYIGRNQDGNGDAYNFPGQFDEFRIEKGVAAWTSNFTPPTAPYTADANTLLLLHFGDKDSFYRSSAGGYFVNTPPSGYKALSTANLPAAVTPKPNQYVTAKTYSGTGGNPSFDQTYKDSTITLSNNYEDANETSGNWSMLYSTNTFSNGKWYAEFITKGGNSFYVGLGDSTKRIIQNSGVVLGDVAGEYAYNPNNTRLRSGGVTISGYPSSNPGDVIMVAVDMDAGKVWFGKNGVWFTNSGVVGNPAAGTAPSYSGITGNKDFAVSMYSTSNPVYGVFGQSGRLGSTNYPSQGGYFYYKPPTGFSGLAVNSSSQNVTLGFKPDLVWIKSRLTANWHTLVDSARGANFNLFSNSTSGQTQNDINGTVTSFNTASFTVGATCSTGSNNVNATANSYVSWAWKESPAAGFDIASYVGNGSLLQNIPHSLGTVPDLILTKATNATGDWFAWTKELGGGSFAKLNTSDAASSLASPFGIDLIPTMTGQTTNGVTITASSQYSTSYQGWYVGDKTSNYWEAPNNTAGYPNQGNPQWLRVDFGTAKTAGAYSISLYNGGQSYAYTPVDFTLEGSNDVPTCSAGNGAAGSVWTVLDSEQSVSWVGYNMGVSKTFSLPPTAQGTYRCYRINITRTTNNEPIISELNLWSGSGVTASSFSVTNSPLNSANGLIDDATGGTAVCSSNLNGNYVPAYAFDRNLATTWLSASVPTGQLEYDLASAKTVVSYSILARSVKDGGSINQTPKSWTFEGWNGTAWVVLDTQTNVGAWSNDEWRTYSFTNATAYGKYRVNISANQSGSSYVGINELTLNENTPINYISYLFSNREGLQKTGVYFGNGSSDGPFVYTGFKPKLVMIKDLSTGNSYTNWTIYDSARDAQTPLTKWLFSNQVYAEGSGDGYCNSSNCPVDFLANGFKIRAASYWNTNVNQDRYVYVAFADVPYKLSAAPGSVSISDSLRIAADASARLTRTPAATGNQQTFTLSLWTKRALVSDTALYRTIFSTANGSTNTSVGLSFGSGIAANGINCPVNANNGGDILEFGTYTYNSQTCSVYDSVNGTYTYYPGNTTNWSVKAVGMYRDPSAWVHIVIAVDTTQATASNRVHMYVNGVEVAYTGTTYPAQNAVLPVDGQFVHEFGGDAFLGNNFYDGYLADVYFVDGQQLDPNSFGEYDSYGYWRPKTFSGFFGTNGFHLDFSSTQATDLSNGSGSTMVGPLYKNTAYTLMCIPIEGGTLSTVANITVASAGLTLAACNATKTSCSTASAPAYLQSGEKAYLTWSALGADANSCNVTYPTGTVGSPNTNSGSSVATGGVTQDTTYTLSCTQGGVATSTTAQVSVAGSCVTGVGSAGASCSNQCVFNTDTLTPNADGAVLSWCCPSVPSAGVNFNTGGARYGYTVVTPDSQKTYQVSCPSGTGSLNLTPHFASITAPGLVATPSRVRRGGTTYLTWSTNGMTSCALYDDIAHTHQVGSGLVSTGNSTPVTINGPTTLTLLCTDGTINFSSSVNVGLLPNFKEL